MSLLAQTREGVCVGGRVLLAQMFLVVGDNQYPIWKVGNVFTRHKLTFHSRTSLPHAW